MNREPQISWKQYFAELVRMAIDKGYADDLDRFSMGMEAADDLEDMKEYEQAWEEYFKERDKFFKSIFDEDFDYYYVEL